MLKRGCKNDAICQHIFNDLKSLFFANDDVINIWWAWYYFLFSSFFAVLCSPSVFLFVQTTVWVPIWRNSRPTDFPMLLRLLRKERGLFWRMDGQLPHLEWKRKVWVCTIGYWLIRCRIVRGRAYGKDPLQKQVMRMARPSKLKLLRRLVFKRRANRFLYLIQNISLSDVFMSMFISKYGLSLLNSDCPSLDQKLPVV